MRLHPNVRLHRLRLLKARLPGREEVFRRNAALEAVKVGDYYSEDQSEVLAYIREQYGELVQDRSRPRLRKWSRPNILTRRYTVADILGKKHGQDGFNIFGNARKMRALRQAAAPASAQDLAALQAEVLSAEKEGGLQLVSLVERCASAGEQHAAVYVFERMAAQVRDVEGLSMPGALPGVPDEVVDRCFLALKPFLKPGAANALTGPWSRPQLSGEMRNMRKAFGKCLNLLVERRARLEPERPEQVAIGRLADGLGPHLAGMRCKRKKDAAELVMGACAAGGLTVSRALAYQVVAALLRCGALRQRGRNVSVSVQEPGPKHALKLREFAADIESLEEAAKKQNKRSLERRKARSSKRARGAY